MSLKLHAEVKALRRELDALKEQVEKLQQKKRNAPKR